MPIENIWKMSCILKELSLRHSETSGSCKQAVHEPWQAFNGFQLSLMEKSLPWAPLFQLQIPGLLCPKVYTKPANAVHHLKKTPNLPGSARWESRSNELQKHHRQHQAKLHISSSLSYVIIIDPPVCPAISHIFSLVWASHRQ